MVVEEIVASMRDTMVYRCPDDAGVWCDHEQRIGLGHRRPSIIDLVPARALGMSNEDGTPWLVSNDEVYNHERLCNLYNVSACHHLWAAGTVAA